MPSDSLRRLINDTYTLVMGDFPPHVNDLIDFYVENGFVRDCTNDGKHAVVRTYRRPWRRWFRKTLYLRCWFCDLEIIEPDWRRL